MLKTEIDNLEILKNKLAGFLFKNDPILTSIESIINSLIKKNSTIDEQENKIATHTKLMLLKESISIEKMQKVITVVYNYYGVPEEFFKRKNRDYFYMLPKSIVRYILYNKYKVPYNMIAKYEDKNTNHATVLSSVKRIKNKVSRGGNICIDCNNIIFLLDN